MSSVFWVDSSSMEEMCQSNDSEKLPWCGKTTRIMWCLPRENKFNHVKESKLSCFRSVTKIETRQKNSSGGSSNNHYHHQNHYLYPSDKYKSNVENIRNGKVKIQESKQNFQKKKCCSANAAVHKKREDKNSGFWKVYLVVVCVAFFCYINAFSGDFVHDDIPAITRNRDVTGQTPILRVLRNDFWGTAMSDPSSHKSYRPLTIFSFRATHAIVGLQSTWFHFFNIILHATASILFTRVCLTIIGFQPFFATTAGVVFAAHPIHTEAVTGIVGRADVLACVFFLMSFLSYHGESNKSCIWSSIALATLSMLAKETGVMVLLLNIFYDFYRSWHSIKRTIIDWKWNEETHRFSRRAAKVLMSLSLLLVFRLALLQSSLPKFSNQDNPAAFHPCRQVRFLTFCYLTALNCWLLLFPANLSHDWQMGSVPLVTGIADSRNMVTCLFFGCLGVLIYKGINDFENQRHPPLVLGLSLLVLPFLPATNLVVTVGFVVAERLLYIPSIGWTILVVYGLQLLRLKQKLLWPAPIIILVILIFCGKTLLRNRDWNSRESLIRSGLKTFPQNAKMHYNFANFLRDTGNTEAAAIHYKEALRLWPTYASAHNNLGAIMNRSEDAEKHFLEAIRYSPHHVNAYYNLGQVYRKVNRTSDALRMLERCINIDMNYTPAYLLLAKLHALDGRKKLVGEVLKRIIELHPQNPDHLAEYAGWLYDQGLMQHSLKYYQRALCHVASHKKSLLGTTKILRAQGQLPRVHQITIRSHIMARAEKGNQIFTGDLYFRSWQLQRQFQQLSNSPKTQYITNPFIQVPHIKRFQTSVPDDIAKASPAVREMSNNPFLDMYKNLESNKRNCTSRAVIQEGNGLMSKCAITENSASTRITIIQGNHRLEPPYDFATKNERTGAKRVLCSPILLDKFVGKESEVPTYT